MVDWTEQWTCFSELINRIKVVIVTQVQVFYEFFKFLFIHRGWYKQIMSSSLHSQYFFVLEARGSTYTENSNKCFQFIQSYESYVHLWDWHKLLIWEKLFAFLHLSDTIRISHVVEYYFRKKRMYLPKCCLTTLDDHYLSSNMSLFHTFSEIKNAEKCQWNEKK